MANSQSEPRVSAAQATPQLDDEAQTTWLHAARGKIIRARFLEGKTLSGRLLTFDRSTIVLQGSEPAPLLVYKQSIAYLAVDSSEA